MAITMGEVVQLLKDTGVFYVATVDGDRPAVRPFSSVTVFEDKVYLCTGNYKPVYRQMLANPAVELSGMIGGAWIRVQGVAVHDTRDEAKIAMLADPSCPSQKYHLGDGIFEVFYLDQVRCWRYDANGTVVDLMAD